MVPILKNFNFPILILIFLSIAQFSIGISIGANFEDNTIQFPHDSCQSELHGKYEFRTFHDARPFIDEEGTFEMLVRFKGVADGHILLSTYENTSEPVYLIIFGSYNNKITEIRRTKAAKPEIKLNTPEILSSSQWRGFVIRYNNQTGHILILPEGMSTHLMEWTDPSPLKINFFSFTTYHGRVIQVAYDCRANDVHSSIPKIGGG